MALKKRGLGRGFDALLGDMSMDSSPSQNKLQTLPIERLQGGQFQPRKHFDTEKLHELANSISAQGVVQPIVVRAIGDDYEIIAGERRWRAAQMAGLHEVPVVIREISDQVALAIALIENLQREDLKPLEQADALQRLLKEFNMTHQQAADAVGKSRVTVSNLLRLLDLHEGVKQFLTAGDIEMGHARALLGLLLENQLAAAEQVIAGRLTVRATEKLVQALLADEKPEISAAVAIDPNIGRLQSDLGEKLGAQVQIKHTNKGRGQLIIKYGSLDELDGVLARIN